MTYQEQINLIIRLVIELSQKNPKNLIKAIKATEVVDDPATAATSACKIICFYVEAFTKGFIKNTFTEFIKHCVENGTINAEDFWLNKLPKDMLKEYSPAASVMRTDSFAEYKRLMSKGNIIGMLRIITGKDANGNDKKHSIMSYSLDGKAMIADTSYRGVGVDAYKYVDEKNFVYFEYMVEGVKI